jgi:hypothetical protein
MKKKDLLIKIERLESKIGKLEREMANFKLVPLTVDKKESVWPTILPDTTPPLSPLSNNMVCPNCGGDSGWATFLCMVIPPEGLRCMSCGRVCIKGNTVTCDSYTQTHAETVNPIPYIVETQPITPKVTCGDNNILTN